MVANADALICLFALVRLVFPSLPPVHIIQSYRTIYKTTEHNGSIINTPHTRCFTTH